MNHMKKWKTIRMICLSVLLICLFQLTAFVVQANIPEDENIDGTCSIEGLTVEKEKTRVRTANTDEWNLADGVIVRSNNNQVLSKECIDQFLIVEVNFKNPPPMVGGTIELIGTHEMLVIVKDKQQQVLADTEFILYVGQPPFIGALNQEYNIEDGVDSKRIIECASGGVMDYNENFEWYENTFDYSPDAPEGTPNVIVSQVVDGPSKQIGQQGLYRLKHSVTTIYGEYIECYSQVVVKQEISVSDVSDTLKISAKGFYMTREEAIASNGDVQSLIQKANAKAYETEGFVYTVSSGYDYNDLTNLISINPHDLQEFKDSVDIEGIYPLSFYIEKDGKSVSKKVSVVIGNGEATNKPATNDGNELNISAHNFQIDYDSSKQLQEKDAITRGNVKASILGSAKDLNEIYVNTAQLGAIQHSPKEGGMFDLTYQVVYQNKEGIKTTYDTTIQVEVVRKDFASTQKQFIKRASASPKTMDETKLQFMIVIIALSSIAFYITLKKVNKTE